VKKFGLLIVYKRLSVNIEPIDANVLSDRRWLSFILEQALSNAVKYTPAGSIHISFEKYRLTVTDTGIGIPPEDLPRIFSKGYTGQNGRLDGRASGIGLYLAKKAADALNIRLNVQSRVGEGTTFTLILPPPDTVLYT
jgi:signal transduction histidine kinase